MVGGLLSAMRKEVRGMHEAAYLLAIFALLSQILALFRDRLFASSFGIGPTLDIYYAAFRVPDFLFATVASLFSLYAILPALARAEGGEARFLERIFLWFFASTSLCAVLLYIALPTIAPRIAPGFDAESLESLVSLSRILLLQPILLGASNVLASLTQLRSRFVLYALSPLLYNIGILIGIVFLYPRFGIEGLGWGVVFGAVMHVSIQIPHFFGERAKEKKIIRAPIYEILLLSVPRTLALSASQLTMIVLVAIASLLSAGSISTLALSMNLLGVPLAIIGVSYSVAAFPTLARLFGRGEREQFLSQMNAALRHIFFWSIPTLVLVVVLRAQIVRVILGTGAFDWSATRLTAALLAIFIISLTAQATVYLLARAYYAAGNTKQPLYFALASVFVSITSSISFLYLFKHYEVVRYFVESLLRVTDVPGTSVLMLALGFSLGAFVQAGLSLFFFYAEFKAPLLPLMRTMGRALAGSIIGGFAAYSALTIMGTFVDIDTFKGIFTQGLVGGLCGLVVTALVLLALRSPELLEIKDALMRKFKDSDPKLAVEPSELSS